MILSLDEIKEFLEEKHDLYNQPSFIETDPIQIPHTFSTKEDIEIAAFLTACIAWGQRSTIIRNAFVIMALLEYAPHDFVVNHTSTDLKRLNSFVHRTFNGTDLQFFIRSLKHIYLKHDGLEQLFLEGYKNGNSIYNSLAHFRETFFEIPFESRSAKHISSVVKGSAAKRLNMFLMWMIRKDKRGVHFGLWPEFSTAKLRIPLDVHSGNTARKLGLLKRKQNDWKAVHELSFKLKQFDEADPIRFDFALFGLGVFEKF
jgi:uncharacterized protein (TIGR02757 family)